MPPENENPGAGRAPGLGEKLCGTASECPIPPENASFSTDGILESLASIRSDFERHGLNTGELIPDGNLYRCPTADKPESLNGWWLVWPDAKGAVCGDWRAGWSQYVSGNGSAPLTPADRARIEQARQEARRARAADQQAAAERAQSLYDRARPASPDHPYLVKKGIKPLPGLRQSGKLLIVPIMNDSGKIVSLQYIGPDGQKRFLKGGQTGGGLFAIKGGETLAICEGLATGASIHEATGCTVLVAFNAGNLRRVAELARKRYQDRRITICADNDTETQGNPGLTAAQDAARTVSGLLAVPDMGGKPCDWNDHHLAHGLERTRAALEQVQEPGPAQAPDEWPNLIPYGDHEAPAIPCDTLPGWAGQYAADMAEAIQVPQALAVCSTLGAIATAAAGAIQHIEIRHGYTEPVNLYLLAPLLPGERKSAALSAAFGPLYQWEQERRLAMLDEITAARSRRKSMEKMIEAKRAKLAKIKDRDELHREIEAIAQDELDLPDIPAPPQLLADDVTPERLAKIMADQGEALGIASAEGGFFESFGRYSTNNIPNLDLFLKAHCAEPYRVDRMARDSIALASPRLTLTLTPQPEILEALTNKTGFRGRGVIARIQYILPDSRLGHRDMEARPIPEHTARTYAEGIRRLLDLRGAALTLDLSPGAYARWLDFARTVEAELGPDGAFSTMTDWAGKLPGAAARLAGLFHCVTADIPSERTVSTETVEQALTLAALLADHAREALGRMGADPTRRAAIKARDWIRRTRARTFTARECWRALHGSFTCMDDLRPGLEALEERGYIRPLPAAPGRGRPSPRYETRPETLEATP
ncbi:DUF3987 domain-containing protein [Desulfonatronum lacustre]|uniref:DUF3987 domain-containing protein n=1 Tax=Desulfonatronum lacustre TaxID=66849 RepID=UPI0004B62A92|nr:DUF3987 domain-containing protein [Desulfonatronum lacustre]